MKNREAKVKSKGVSNANFRIVIDIFKSDNLSKKDSDCVFKSFNIPELYNSSFVTCVMPPSCPIEKWSPVKSEKKRRVQVSQGVGSDS